MKKLYLLFCISSLYSLAYAQLPSEVKRSLYARHNMGFTLPGSIVFSSCEHLDTCILRVTYDVSFINDTLQKDKPLNDIQVLEIGKHVSHCFSYLLYKNDSLVTALDKKGGTELPSLCKYVIPEEIFIFKDKKLTQVLNRTPWLFPCYWYTESSPVFEWKLLDSQKDVLGYSCQKATCRFRGRDYVAWYAADIPLRYGPYKFGGLPGLILEMSDTQNDYKWKCIAIKKGNNKWYVNRNKSSKGKNIDMTRERARKMVARYYQDPAGALLLNIRIKGIVGPDNIHRTFVAGDFPSEPYNPIEKE